MTASNTEMTVGELLRRHRLEATLTQKELAKLLTYDHTTVSRVERNERVPSQEYIHEVAEALHLPETQRRWLTALYEAQITGQAGEPIGTAPTRREDWGQAPDVSIFYGRQAELTGLAHWIADEQCRLVAVLGMGGIGKTFLVTKLARQVKADFDYVIWRSLRNALPLSEILIDWLKFLSGQQLEELPEDIGRQLQLLGDLLRQKRCLIILDNAEAILQEGGRAGHYRQGYENYGQLLRQVGEMAHRSCLLLTSREKPRELIPLASDTAPVRTLVLTGLTQADSQTLLRDRTLHGDEAAWVALTQRYAGNPLALRQVSATIQDLYGGDIPTFLEEITTMFGEMKYLLDQQFNRLSKLEQDIMYWLAIEREPVTLQDLREDLVDPVQPGELLEALEALQRRSLIERSAGRFTLQNVITEYLTERLIERVCEEIILGKWNLFNCYALLKATAKDYVRESQSRLILGPVAEQLLTTLTIQAIKDKLIQTLWMRHQVHPTEPGYKGGNTLNLLVFLRCNLNGLDFSNLTVSQAYFKDKILQDVNFAYSNFIRSVFSESFGSVISIAFSPDDSLLAISTSNDEKGCGMSIRDNVSKPW